MAETIEEFAVKLLADASGAMDAIKSIVDDAGQAGEEAGQAFYDAMSKQLAEVGNIARLMAETMGVSFREAAEQLQAEGGFTMFNAADIEAAAQALSEFNVPLEGGIGPLKEHVELQTALAEILKTEIEPAVEETKNFYLELVNAFVESGGVIGDDVIPQLEKIGKEMNALKDEQEIINALTADFIPEVQEMAYAQRLAEEQILKVVAAYREMGVAIPDALQRDKIRDHVKELVKHADGVGDVREEVGRFTQSIIQKGQALKGNETILGKVTGLLGQFGINIGGMLPHLAAGTLALGAMKKAFDEIKQATEFAYNLTFATEELAAAFRINQLAGDENTMTFREWYTVAEEVRTITGQPLQKSIQGVTEVLRELGASTELTDTQINDLILSGAEFTKQYGGTLPQSVSQLSDFINTGLSEALQRLGLDIDKAAQNQKAFDMNLGSNIDKLSEADQRTVRYALIMEELSEKTADADDGLVSLNDQIVELNERSETASKTLGDLFVPLKIAFKEIGVNIKEGFVKIVNGAVEVVQRAISIMVGGIIAAKATIQFVLDNFDEQGTDVLKGIGQKFADAWAQADLELFAFSVEQATGGLDQYAQSAEDAVDATNELEEAVAATTEQIEGFIEAARKFDEGMKKIEQKFLDRMDSITLEFTNRRKDMETDFLRELRDIDADAAVDRLQTIRDFQVDEIRLREDHQLDIRQLEERFILDLEDAVRERDARGVLNLQRRFNLEKKQREEDFLLKNKRLKEDFGLEMQEIEFQRQRRRQERFVAYQEELLDLQMQEERKRELAATQRARAERDLIDSINSRLLALQTGVDGELAIEQELLDNLIEALVATYGPDGPWVLWHQEAVKTTQAAAGAVHDAQGELIASLWRTEGAIRAHVAYQQRAAQQIAAAWQATRIQMQSRVGTGVQQFQRGGSFVATSPRQISVGEGRPERVSIAPLSAGTGQPSAGFRGGGAGERVGIDLNVDASEMLVVEVADQTMTEIADIMVNVNSRGYQGGRGA